MHQLEPNCIRTRIKLRLTCLATELYHRLHISSDSVEEKGRTVSLLVRTIAWTASIRVEGQDHCTGRPGAPCADDGYDDAASASEGRPVRGGWERQGGMCTPVALSSARSPAPDRSICCGGVPTVTSAAPSPIESLLEDGADGGAPSITAGWGVTL